MKPILTALAAAALVTACATTVSPTGRTQYVGAVSQAQLDQLGEQSFVQMKTQQQVSNDARQNAYVSCVVNAIVQQLPANEQRIRWESAVFVDDNPNAFMNPILGRGGRRCRR